MIYKLILLFVIALLIFSCSDEELPYHEDYLCIYNLDSNNNDYIIPKYGMIAKFNFDASKIIVTTNSGFWSIHSDGSNFQNYSDSLIAKFGTFYTSPINDDWIFVDNNEIYKMNIDNELQCLTDEFDEDVKYCNYSYDGSKIIFSTKLDSLESYINKIYLMNTDGSNLDLIYESELENEWIMYPIISEDTEMVFFIKNDSGLYMLNIDTADIEVIDPDVSSYTGPSTSSNFLVYDKVSQEIFIYDFVNNSFIDILDGEKPSISPDGNKITYYRIDDLYVYYIAENDEDRLAEASSYFQFFSHDSQSIVFWGQKGSRTKGITSLEHKVRDEN